MLIKVFIKRIFFFLFLYINVRDCLNNWVYSIIYYGYILFLFFNDKCKKIYKYFFKVKLNLI